MIAAFPFVFMPAAIIYLGERPIEERGWRVSLIASLAGSAATAAPTAPALMIARLCKPMMIVAGLLLFAAIGNLLAIKRLDGYHVYKALKERGEGKEKELRKRNWRKLRDQDSISPRGSLLTSW